MIPRVAGGLSQPGPARLIITCPNCQTRYKVATTALSAAGRQVQCAACSTSWVAAPSFPKPDLPSLDPDPDDDELAFRADRDTLFSADDESMLDSAFAREEAEETAKADLAAAAEVSQTIVEDGTLAQGHRNRLAQRKRAVISALPRERLRRTMRILVALILFGMIAGGVAFRTEIVRAAPAMDALYRTVGLGTTRDGQSVIVVTAKIVNIVNRVTFVPTVLVSLLDAEGAILYEWTVAPTARNLLPGDVLGMDTQLTAPPEGVERARLTFIPQPSASGATL